MKPEYSGTTRSIAWLLMPWLLVSPGHQHPCYWYIYEEIPVFHEEGFQLHCTCAFSLLRNDRKCWWIFMFLNSLAPGRFEQNFRKVIFKLISVTDCWGISCEIALRRMPLDLTDDKSTLVQVMVWCHQATSHYLSQCWPRFMLPYGVTRPQWVKLNSACRRFNKLQSSA